MSYIIPSSESTYQESLLTRISIASFQKPNDFVASQVFPDIKVKKQSGTYFEYDMGYFNRGEMEERLPGTESAGGVWKVAKKQYYCPIYALHDDIYDPVRANADSILQYDKSSTIFVTTGNLRTRERLWVQKCFITSDPGDIWGFALRGGATRSAPLDPLDKDNNEIKFWDHADSTPIQDIRFLTGYMGEASGTEPNILTINRKVYNALVDHPDILGRVGRGNNNSAITVNETVLADLFDVERVYVMRAIMNTAKEGQTDNNKYIGGNHALLTYRPSSPALMEPSAGYTFNWSGFENSRGSGQRINKIRMETKKTDRIEMEASFSQTITGSHLGGIACDVLES